MTIFIIAKLLDRKKLNMLLDMSNLIYVVRMLHISVIYQLALIDDLLNVSLKTNVFFPHLTGNLH